jgi:hypothetical protein
MQVEIFKTEKLETLVDKLIFIEKYIGNFIDANPNYRTEQEVVITKDNNYELTFKIWKM